MKKIWKKNLAESEKHLALYCKGHYVRGNLLEDLETLHAIDKGGVISRNKCHIIQFLNRTHLKLVGPFKYIYRMEDVISDPFDELKTDITPNNMFESLISYIALVKTSGERPEWLPDEREYPFLKNVEAKPIELDESHNLYPK